MHPDQLCAEPKEARLEGEGTIRDVVSEPVSQADEKSVGETPGHNVECDPRGGSRGYAVPKDKKVNIIRPRNIKPPQHKIDLSGACDLDDNLEESTDYDNTEMCDGAKGLSDFDEISIGSPILAMSRECDPTPSPAAGASETEWVAYKIDQHLRRLHTTNEFCKGWHFPKCWTKSPGSVMIRFLFSSAPCIRLDEAKTYLAYLEDGGTYEIYTYRDHMGANRSAQKVNDNCKPNRKPNKRRHYGKHKNRVPKGRCNQA